MIGTTLRTLDSYTGALRAWPSVVLKGLGEAMDGGRTDREAVSIEGPEDVDVEVGCEPDDGEYEFELSVEWPLEAGSTVATETEHGGEPGTDAEGEEHGNDTPSDDAGSTGPGEEAREPAAASNAGLANPAQAGDDGGETPELSGDREGQVSTEAGSRTDSGPTDAENETPNPAEDEESATTEASAGDEENNDRAEATGEQAETDGETEDGGVRGSVLEVGDDGESGSDNDAASSVLNAEPESAATTTNPDEGSGADEQSGESMRR